MNTRKIESPSLSAAPSTTLFNFQPMITATPHLYILLTEESVFAELCKQAENEKSKLFLSCLCHYKASLKKDESGSDFALALCQQLKEIIATIDPPDCELRAAVYNLLGMVLRVLLKDFDAAIDNFTLALAEKNRLSVSALASILCNLADAHRVKGNVHVAYMRQQETLEYVRKIPREHVEHRHIAAMIYRSVSSSASAVLRKSTSMSESIKRIQEDYSAVKQSIRLWPDAFPSRQRIQNLLLDSNTISVLAADIDGCLYSYADANEFNLSRIALREMQNKRYDHVFLMTHRCLTTIMANTIAKFHAHLEFQQNQNVFTYKIVEHLAHSGIHIAGISTPDDAGSELGDGSVALMKFEQHLACYPVETLQELQGNMVSMMSSQFQTSTYTYAFFERLNRKYCPEGDEYKDIKAGISRQYAAYDRETKNPQLAQLFEHLSRKYPDKNILVTYMDDMLCLLHSASELIIDNPRHFLSLIHCDSNNKLFLKSATLCSAKANTAVDEEKKVAGLGM